MTGEGTTGKSLSSDPSHYHWDLRRERNRLGMGGQGWWWGALGGAHWSESFQDSGTIILSCSQMTWGLCFPV